MILQPCGAVRRRMGDIAVDVAVALKISIRIGATVLTVLQLVKPSSLYLQSTMLFDNPARLLKRTNQ